MTLQARLEAALDDHRSGRLAEAIAGYRHVLASERDNATAEAMLGVALAQAGVPKEGLPRLRRAAALVPDDAGLHENLGACLDQAGKRASAGLSYLRSSALAIAAGSALAAAAAARIDGGSPDALRLFRRAMALSPAEAKWWEALGEAALKRHLPDLAVICFRRALDLGAVRSHVLDRLAEALLRIGAVEQAAAAYELLMVPARTSRWYRPELAESGGVASGSDSFRVTSAPKLRHDILQFEYLMERGFLPPPSPVPSIAIARCWQDRRAVRPTGRASS